MLESSRWSVSRAPSFSAVVCRDRLGRWTKIKLSKALFNISCLQQRRVPPRFEFPSHQTICGIDGFVPPHRKMGLVTSLFKLQLYCLPPLFALFENLLRRLNSGIDRVTGDSVE